jgi:hypothetical protein
MNAIKEILVNGGYITTAHVGQLEKDFPNLKVCIKWGQAQRQLTTLKNLRNLLKAGAEGGDYVREVFVPADLYHTLQGAFGITDEDVQEYYKTFSELMSKQSL